MIWPSHKNIILSIVSLAFAGLAFAQTPAAPAPAVAAPAQPEAAPVQPAEQVQPAPVAQAAPIAAEAEAVAVPRGAAPTLDEMIQAKLDSMSSVAPAAAPRNADSLAKAKADSVRKMIQEGKYVQRAKYDKSNFDHWKQDTVFQKKMKEKMVGVWRTKMIAHGHAFRDAEIRFGANDTLVGVTRTYSDSGRYQMTGEYTYKARYRFDNDTTMVTREVFSDRKVIRWDFVNFKMDGDKLVYSLKKLEFRDLNDNWLNALQGFDNVPPEVYFKDVKASEPAKGAAKAAAPAKK